jgi:O-antigen ligase
MLACDVRADLAAAGRIDPARTTSAVPAPAAGAALVVVALMLALLGSVLLASSSAMRVAGHALRAAPIIAVVAYAALVVLGTRPLDLLGGDYPSQLALELLELAAIVLVLASAGRAGRRCLTIAWQRTAPLRHPSMVLLVAFVAFAAWSRSWTANVDNAAPTLASMFGGVAAVASLAVLAGWSRRVGTAALATFAIAAGPFALLGGAWLPRVGGRMVGVPGDPNLLGLAFAASASIALAAIASGGRRRLVAWGAPLVALTAIAGIGATQSRGAVVALVVGIVVTALLVRSRRVVAIGSIALAATMAAVLLPAIVDDAPGASALARTAAGDSSSGRLDTWSNALRQVADNPVEGVGIGGFVTSIDRYRVPGDHSLVQAAHNTPLQVAAELGIVGLGLGGAALAALVVPLWRRARAGDVLAACWCAAGASLAASSMLLTTYADPVPWAILAIGCGIVATRRPAETARVADSDDDEGDALAPILQLGERRHMPRGDDQAERRTDAA